MIEINWSILVQMTNFLLLIFILNIVLYKPLLKILNERDKRISETQQKTKDFSEETEKMISAYNEKFQAKINIKARLILFPFAFLDKKNFLKDFHLIFILILIHFFNKSICEIRFKVL